MLVKESRIYSVKYSGGLLGKTIGKKSLLLEPSGFILLQTCYGKTFRWVWQILLHDLLKNKFQFSPETWWCSRTPELGEKVLLWSSSITKTSGVITYCWFSHHLSLLPYFKRLGPVGTWQLNLVLWGLVVAVVNDAHKHSANCWELAWGKCFLFLVLFFVTML